MYKKIFKTEVLKVARLSIEAGPLRLAKAGVFPAGAEAREARELMSQGSSIRP